MGSSFPAVEPAPLRLGDDPAGGTVLMHVVWRAFDSIHRVEAVTRLQSTVIAVTERFASSPRVRAHGLFADVRGGFALIEVRRAGELMELLAGLSDVASVDAHPVADTGEALGHLRGMLVTEDLIG